MTYAERTYPALEGTSRVDARGEIYIRYGEPSVQMEVDYNEASFQTKVFRFGVPVSLSDFPANELWLYPKIDASGYYLFVKQGSTYRLATSTVELLPSTLRHNFSRSKRGLNKAVSAMAALRYIYRQLAMYHIDFSDRYNTVARYMARQEERAMKAEMGASTRGSQVRVGEGIGRQQTVVTEDPVAGLSLPHEKVQRILDQSRMADRRARQRRRNNMPRQRTQFGAEAAPLLTAVRIARFLKPNGATGTEVYWGLPPGALRLSERQREMYDGKRLARSRPLLHFTAVRQGADGEHKVVCRKRYLLQSSASQGASRTIPPRS